MTPSIPVYRRTGPDGQLERPHIKAYVGPKQNPLRLALTSRQDGIIFFDARKAIPVMDQVNRIEQDVLSTIEPRLCSFSSVAKNHIPMNACGYALDTLDELQLWEDVCAQSMAFSDLNGDLDRNIQASARATAWRDGDDVLVANLAEGFVALAVDADASWKHPTNFPRLIPARFLDTEKSVFPDVILKQFDGFLGLGAGPSCRPGYNDRTKGPEDLWTALFGEEYDMLRLSTHAKEHTSGDELYIGDLAAHMTPFKGISESINPSLLATWFDNRTLQPIPSTSAPREAGRSNIPGLSFCNEALTSPATNHLVGAMIDLSLPGLQIPEGYVWDSLSAWLQAVPGIHCDYKSYPTHHPDVKKHYIGASRWPTWVGSSWFGHETSPIPFNCTLDKNSKSDLPPLTINISKDRSVNVSLSNLLIESDNERKLMVTPNILDNAIAFRREIMVTLESIQSLSSVRPLGAYPFSHPSLAEQQQNGSLIWPPILLGYSVILDTPSSSADFYRKGGFQLNLANESSHDDEHNHTCPMPVQCGPDEENLSSLRLCIPPRACTSAWCMTYNDDTHTCEASGFVLPSLLFIVIMYSFFMIKRSLYLEKTINDRAQAS